MSNPYCPKRGKRGKEAEKFVCSLFKNKLKLDVKPLPRGRYNEDILIQICNTKIIIEVEYKHIDKWSSGDNSFSEDSVYFASRRKIRENCFQLVLNSSHTRFIIYSHDVIKNFKDEWVDSETGRFLVKKIPLNLCSEFSVWDFDKQELFSILDLKENLKMKTKKTRENRVHISNRYFWKLSKFTKNFSNKDHKKQMLDIVSEWCEKYAESGIPAADTHIDEEYSLSGKNSFEYIRQNKLWLKVLEKGVSKSPVSINDVGKILKSINPNFSEEKRLGEIKKHIIRNVKTALNKQLSPEEALNEVTSNPISLDSAEDCFKFKVPLSAIKEDYLKDLVKEFDDFAISKGLSVKQLYNLYKDYKQVC
jgi:hypothetical protein